MPLIQTLRGPAHRKCRYSSVRIKWVESRENLRAFFPQKESGSIRFLGNSPPAPPLSQRFALSEN